MWIIALLIAVSVAVLFIPQLKGWRTQSFAVITATWSAILPLFAEMFDYFRGLKWDQYFGPEAAPWIILSTTVVFMILRFMTTTPVGKKH
jgi:hypothetical protein